MQSKIEWLKYPENKPTHDAVCVVTNEKGWLHFALAHYYIGQDVFIEDNPERRQHYPLEISHYIEIPPLPR